MRILKKSLTTCFFFACTAMTTLHADDSISKKVTPITPESKTVQKNEKPSFVQWLKNIRLEALRRGISQEVIDDALPLTLTLSQKVIDIDKAQAKPHNKKTTTLKTYSGWFVNKKYIKQSVDKFNESRSELSDISKKMGVDSSVIVALWAVESTFGKKMGDFSAVQALASLSYDGRRDIFFKNELFELLKIIEKENSTSSNFKSSWAGALGQPQFMPSSFLAYACDWNGDGKKDIWKTKTDVFASIANYLKTEGWEENQPIAEEVILPPDFDKKLLGFNSKDMLKKRGYKTPHYWNEKGVRMPNGEKISGSLRERTYIIQPDGLNTQAYILRNNFRVIFHWNHFSKFVITISKLSDAISENTKELENKNKDRPKPEPLRPNNQRILMATAQKLLL